MYRPFRAILLAALAPLAACGDESAANGSGAAPADPVTAAASIQPITTPEIHDARCGHTLEEHAPKCGNYVELGGRWVEIVWPDLGAMEFCKDGEKGAKVKIAGEMKDGKFVASSYERVVQ